MKHPGRFTRSVVGALAAGMVTVCLVALLYAANVLFGLPFAPFEIFDWLARVLPGGLVTLGIDLIVGALGVVGTADLSEAAKAAEAALAVALFVLAGAVAGALLVPGFLRRAPGSSLLPAALVGAVLGVFTAIVTSSIGGSARVAPLAAGLWHVATLTLWGAVVGWTADRLFPRPAPLATGSAAEDADLAPGGAEAGAWAGDPEGTGDRVGQTQGGDGTAQAERIDRRRFLVRLGGATAAITVVGAGVGALLRRDDGGAVSSDTVRAGGRWSQSNPLPNEGTAVRPVPGTRPELTPPDDHYRIDINLRSQDVDAESWRLSVAGLVDEEREFTLEQLQAYPATDEFITLSCISNPIAGGLISTTRWTGVSLQRLLPDLQLRPEATHLRISSVDGFYEVVALETIAADERVMLAYAWDGLPLPARNGFPLRIYIPDLYGMKQPKWIDRIEAIGGWEEGYWVERGWDAQAQMRTTSVIDTVAVDLLETRDGVPVVPVGGIAHAGARGISRVEVSVDDGDWQEAQLREPLSGLTWVIWRIEWPFEPGRHVFRVRCFDGSGELQPTEFRPTHPSGATGVHALRENL